MKGRTINVCIAMVLLGLSGCEYDERLNGQAAQADASGRSQHNAQTVTIDLATPEAGTTIALDRGTDLLIALQENRTTAYRWSVAETPAQVRLLDDDYAGDHYGGPDDPQPVGAGGTRTLRLRAEQPGRGRLVLRHGSGVGPAAQTVVIEVTVR